MSDWVTRVPPIDWALVAMALVAALVAVATGHRGGRYRGLAGWALFWLGLAALLIALSRGWPRVSLSLLGLMMFALLRTYFFVAPVRAGDRMAVFAGYLAIPFALYPGFTGSTATFLATVPIVLFLLFPVLVTASGDPKGLLDTTGRILVGVLVFVFCAAHLGLLVGGLRGMEGLLELFGVLVLAAEIPQRLVGRWVSGVRWWRPLAGVALGLALAVWLGFRVGPWCGLVEEDGGRAGALVAIAVTMGARVADSVLRDLGMGASSSRVGRGAFLDRAIPALYAAPVYFHYLNHFA